MSSCLASGHRCYTEAGMDHVLIADCLRRCGDFAAALDWIGRGLAEEIDPRARAQLLYERKLVEAVDTDAHLEDETPHLAVVRRWPRQWSASTRPAVLFKRR